MKIAVELNNIIRDYNNQVLKYYRKGIDPTFNDEEIDIKCTDILEHLPFKTNAEKKTFKEIDYPYELFGCARTTNKHLHIGVSDWLEDNEDIEIIYFSLNESNLMIQSTYFFLSKGSRIKTMKFIDNPKNIWKYCDVAVTLNKEIVDSKPENKKVIVINRSDNKRLQEKADLCYEKFSDILNDKKFVEKLNNTNKKRKITSRIKKLLKWMK